MDASDEFSSPFNWCDGRCEVCPRARQCPVSVRLDQRRWVHTARGEDPDDPAVVMKDVVDDFKRTIEMLQDMALEEGICLDEPVPEEPVSLSSKRLDRCAFGFFEALCQVERGCDTEAGALVGAAIEAASTLVAKVGRIGGYDGPDDPVWFADAVPNLLLIEQLLDRVGRSLEALRSRLAQQDLEGVDGAYADLRRHMGGHLRAIPPRARLMLSALVDEGQAPSPFCTVEPLPPVSSCSG